MDLFNYVMQTPANTNPAVLSSEISKAIEESQVQADYAQNDPNKKDYIKNKPFYQEVEIVTELVNYGNNTAKWYLDRKSGENLHNLDDGGPYVVYSRSGGKGVELFAFNNIRTDGDDDNTDWSKGEGVGWRYTSLGNKSGLLQVDPNRFDFYNYSSIFGDHVEGSIGKIRYKGTLSPDILPVSTNNSVGAIKAQPLPTGQLSGYEKACINKDDSFLYCPKNFFDFTNFTKNNLLTIPLGRCGVFSAITSNSDTAEFLAAFGEETLFAPLFIYHYATDYGSYSYYRYVGFGAGGQSFSFNLKLVPGSGLQFDSISPNLYRANLTPINEIFLSSPNGTTYSLGVNDDGTLSINSMT